MNKVLKGGNEKHLVVDLAKVSDATVADVIDPYDITVCSIVSVLKQGIKVIRYEPASTDAKLLFSLDSNYNYFKDSYRMITYQEMEAKGLDQEAIDQVLKMGYLLFLNTEQEEKMIIPIPELLNTVAKICKVGKLPKDSNPIRELYLAYILSEADPFRLVYRNNGTYCTGITCLGEKTKWRNQSSYATEILQTIHEKFAYSAVSWYEISDTLTRFKVDLTELTFKKTGAKKYLFSPGFLITISDTGDYMNSIQTVVGINGRIAKVGVPLPLENISEENIEMATVEMKRIISFLDSVESENEVKKSDAVLELAKKINLQSVGQKIFQQYSDWLSTENEEECSNIDVVAELMSFPSKIDMICGKNTPQYITEKSERLIGDMLKTMV